MHTKLTKVQAARAAGVSHTTIWRAVKDGRLSAERLNDDVCIDASELLRVYPDANLSRARERTTNRSRGAHEHAREQADEQAALFALIDELKHDKRRQADELDRAASERAALLAMLREKDEAIKEKDRLLAETMQTVKFLTDQREKKRGWFARWRRRA